MSVRAAWPTMGSVASLTIPRRPDDPTLLAAPHAIDEVRAWFDLVESVLSPYRADSDLCRWRCGEVDLSSCSELLGEVVADVRSLEQFTEGGFHPFDRAGRYDPTGYVKGWAVQRGCELLARRGITSACLGVGGDIQMIGRCPDRPWRAAVADPTDCRRVLAIVQPVEDGHFAVATSGDAQRGEHIWAALGGPLRASRPDSGRLACITVVGPELRLADAFATALWAQSLARPIEQCWGWLTGSGYEALAVERSGAVHATPGMGAHLVRPAA